MRHKNYRFFIIILFFISGQTLAQKTLEQQASLPLRKPVDKPMATLININNISMWVQADGKLGWNPHTNDSGVIYPRETSCVVYCDGVIWGGFVRDGHDPELRTGGGMWRVGTVPGAILSKGVSEDPSSSDVRIWRNRRDWQTVDLAGDAAEFFGVSVDSVTQMQIDAVRSQYQKDRDEWPWQKGAPFYDENHNGMMEEGENPGLAFADQVVWFVANDLDTNSTINFMGSPPIGIEMQVTLWAYNRTGSRLNDALQHVIFKKVKLIYKGRRDTPDTATIDSMFVGQFVDTEIGSASDDFAGGDTVLQLAYGYNSDSFDREFQKFNLPPPAFGYTLIYGPLIPSNNPFDIGTTNFQKRSGHTNSKMTSFWLHASGGVNGPPGGKTHENTIRLYNLLNGYYPWTRLTPFRYSNGNKTKFIVCGDPVAGTGWIDGLVEETDFYPHYGYPGGGVRYFSMNSGPFTMALGDTQTVVLAVVGGLGSDRLASVSVMKYFTKWARQVAKDNFEVGFAQPEPATPDISLLPQDFRLYQNYPNPFNSGTEIRYDLPVQRRVKLTIYNLLGQMVKVLIDKNQEAKSYKIRWDGTDSRGEKVPTGLYLYRIEAGAFILMKKMLLVE